MQSDVARPGDDSPWRDDGRSVMHLMASVDSHGMSVLESSMGLCPDSLFLANCINIMCDFSSPLRRLLWQKDVRLRWL